MKVRLLLVYTLVFVSTSFAAMEIRGRVYVEKSEHAWEFNPNDGDYNKGGQWLVLQKKIFTGWENLAWFYSGRDGYYKIILRPDYWTLGAGLETFCIRISWRYPYLPAPYPSADEGQFYEHYDPDCFVNDCSIYSSTYYRLDDLAYDPSRKIVGYNDIALFSDEDAVYVEIRCIPIIQPQHALLKVSGVTADSYVFNDGVNQPGDGHPFTWTPLDYSGSGTVTVEQININPVSIPCVNPLGLYWTMTIDSTITDILGNLTFTYLESDLGGIGETRAFLGIAQFFYETQTWKWLDVVIDSDHNTLTLNNAEVYSTYALCGRILGDVSGDGYVDAADLQRLGDVWHHTSHGEFTGGEDDYFFNFCKCVNQTGQQIVDAADLQVFGDCWHLGIQPPH